MTEPTQQQLLEALTRRMDILELEVAMWKSVASRTKNAWAYAEEAVAAEYGILVSDFWRQHVKRGKPKNGQHPTFRQAQYLLFALLNNVIGLNVEDIRANYGSWASHYCRFWGELYNLIHRPRPMTKAEQVAYDLYAPRFKGAYERMKSAMIHDGVWSELYDDELTYESSHS